MQQRVHPLLGDVLVLRQVPVRIEAGTRVAAQLRADGEVVLHRAQAEGEHVGVFVEVPLLVEDARVADQLDVLFHLVHFGLRPSDLPWVM